MTCHETTQSLGAYVLGSLEPADRILVDAHLLDCPACAAELADLEELPLLLDRLSIDDVEAPIVVPPPDLFDRVAAAARREHDQQHRFTVRRRLLVGVAAAVIVIAAAVGVGVHGSSTKTPTFAASSGQVHMSVTVTAEEAGTDLHVSVAGLPVDEQCKLIAVSRAGARDVAGSWVATYSGTAQVTGSTMIARGQLTELILLGTNGQELVTVPV
jgi:predicted anti-sigma-YlaC factor YlaD